MKNIVVLLLPVLLTLNSLAEITRVEGIFQGKNLFVQNSLVDDKKGEFCIKSVAINGEEIPDEVRSSAFVVSLDRMGLELGEKITIVFRHENNCAPLVINPEVLKPLSTYKIAHHELKDGYLVFETTNESSKLSFFVEEYRWDRWLSIDEIMGEGGPGNNTYKVKIFPHKGINMYRMKQIDHMNRVHFSDTMEYQLDIETVKLKTPGRVTNEIVFSKETLYELYNSFGERVRFGGGAVIDVSDLPNDFYFLSFGNNVVEIEKH
ncbi:MAG: hypothetical protein PF590_10010 [Candidatus Delongbacteria bacterium]|jgi:hypothetical protein|nr:hypothetical protein [Candidatus Delongbacteria bacterium]